MLEIISFDVGFIVRSTHEGVPYRLPTGEELGGGLPVIPASEWVERETRALARNGYDRASARRDAEGVAANMRWWLEERLR